MAIPFLKVDPEKAIEVIEKCIVSGYKLKDTISNQYHKLKDGKRWGDNSETLETIQKWKEQEVEWTNISIKELGTIFTSQRELYNFRDARPPFGATSEDVRYVGIIDRLNARIGKLDQFTQFIFNQYNIQFTVQAKRDAIIQTGSNSKTEIKN